MPSRLRNTQETSQPWEVHSTATTVSTQRGWENAGSWHRYRINFDKYLPPPPVTWGKYESSDLEKTVCAHWPALISCCPGKPTGGQMLPKSNRAAPIIKVESRATTTLRWRKVPSNCSLGPGGLQLPGSLNVNKSPFPNKKV